MGAIWCIDFVQARVVVDADACLMPGDDPRSTLMRPNDTFIGFIVQLLNGRQRLQRGGEARGEEEEEEEELHTRWAAKSA